MEKWYSFETIERELKDALSVYLKTQGIYYELPGAGNGWHFEIKTDTDGLTKINGFLDDYYA